MVILPAIDPVRETVNNYNLTSWSVIPELGASTLPGNLLDMEISGCTSDLPNQKPGLRPGNVYFNKPFKCFWCTPIFENHCLKYYLLVAQMVKNLPAVWETWAWSLGWEDPLEEDMGTHSSTLVWRIPMDRGAWQAAIHGVAKSQTWVSDYHFEFLLKNSSELFIVT